MFFLEPCLLSVIIALIRRGSIMRLADIELRRFWLVYVPISVVLVSWLCKGHMAGQTWVPIVRVLNFVTAAALFTVFWSNLSLPGGKWLFSGWLLNFTVIAANSGQMPVSQWALKVVGAKVNGPAMQHHFMTAHTSLKFLGDYIPAPRPYLIFPEIASPGDILMMIGLFYLIQMTMCPRKKKAEG